ncbi:MAG: glycosyltransferase family 39 protein [Myxococcales bacterium]|nr:glycosyltransferase family 39 protein [Myxococcales bacterium]
MTRTVGDATPRLLRPAVVAPFLVFLALAISYWMHGYRIPASDEGAILTQASKILRGAVYYRDLDAYPFPGATYALAGAMALLGEHLNVARFLATLLFCGIVVAVYSCALQLIGAARAAVVGVSMLSFKFLASPSLNGFFYWDFSFCFAAVSVAMFLAHLRERSVGWLVASGAACGVAFASKQTVGAFLGMAALGLLLLPGAVGIAGPRTPRDRAVDALRFLGGMAIPSVPMFAYFAFHGVLPQMVSSGLLRPFVSYLPTSGLSFTAALRWWEFGAFWGVPGLPYHIEPVWTLLMEGRLPSGDWYPTYWAISEAFSRLLYSSVVIAFAWVGVRYLRALFGRRLGADAHQFAFAVLAFAVLLSAFPRADYPHVISVYPLILVLLFSLWGATSRRWLAALVRGGEIAACVVLLVLSVGLSARQFSFLTHELKFDTATLRVSPKSAWVDSVVKYVSAEVPEGEPILVYGHEAFYYFLTQRFYPWPFAQLYPGQAGGDGGVALGSLMLETPPKLVLRGMIKFPGIPFLPDYAPYLDRVLKARYARERSVFERFPPAAGKPPRYKAFTVLSPRKPPAKNPRVKRKKPKPAIPP